VSRRLPARTARARREVERELRRLERQRDDLDRAIARLRQALAFLNPAARAAPQSLTNACRVALRSTPAGLTPQDVRELLTRDGFRWTAFSSPLSAIHTVLKRLVSQGEASAAVDDQGRRRFVWKRRGWDGYPRSQAEEAARIQHLLDGALTAEEYSGLRKRWRLNLEGRR